MRWDTCASHVGLVRLRLMQHLGLAPTNVTHHMGFLKKKFWSWDVWCVDFWVVTRRLTESPNPSSLPEAAPAPAAIAQAPTVPDASSVLSPFVDPFIPDRSFTGRSKLRRWKDDSISLVFDSNLERSPPGHSLPDLERPQVGAPSVAAPPPPGVRSILVQGAPHLALAAGVKGPCLDLIIEWQPRWTNICLSEIHMWLVHKYMCVSNICHR